MGLSLSVPGVSLIACQDIKRYILRVDIMSGNQEGLTLPAISNQKSAEAAQKSTRKYGFEISPSGYKRRINNEGVSMLEAILEKRETDKQVGRVISLGSDAVKQT